jgi:hypothetical protein
MTLPNNRKVENYADETNRVLAELVNNADEKFKPSLEAHRKEIRDVFLKGGGELYLLAVPLDRLLNDTGAPNDPNKPNLQEFWQQQTDLRERLVRLLEAVRYGDPYLVARTFGKGRVLACMSTANTAWNDMPNGISRPYYVMLMVEIEKYLASNVSDTNLLLGAPLEINLDATRFESKARQFSPIKGEPQPGKPLFVDDGDKSGEVSGNRVIFRSADAKRPGVYQFVINRKDAPDPDKKDAPKTPEKGDTEKVRQETLAFAYNIDAQAESDLRRASLDDIATVAPQALFHRPGDGSYEGTLKQRKSDLSELSWLFLLFLIVLFAEQALAVRLSFHTAHNAEPAR